MISQWVTAKRSTPSAPEGKERLKGQVAKDRREVQSERTRADILNPDSPVSLL